MALHNKMILGQILIWQELVQIPRGGVPAVEWLKCWTVIS